MYSCAYHQSESAFLELYVKKHEIRNTIYGIMNSTEYRKKLWYWYFWCNLWNKTMLWFALIRLRLNKGKILGNPIITTRALVNNPKNRHKFIVLRLCGAHCACLRECESRVRGIISHTTHNMHHRWLDVIGYLHARYACAWRAFYQN